MTFQCYFCSDYYGRKDKFKRHIENCKGRPSYVYNFNLQSLLTFEENLKFKCDIPMTAFIDFEITAPTDDCLDPESKKMFAVSYVIIFALHPELQLDRVINERSFAHSQMRLCSLNYLTSEQLKFKTVTMFKQLRDCALSVASKRNKLAISEMFTTELKFAGNCLMRWFNAKIKSEDMELSNDMRRKYEVKNPIIWQTDRCCICTFPIEINPTMSDATKDNMYYGDFVIFKEHKFLRNIFSEEELSSSTALKNIHTYHKNFSRFLKVAIYLQNSLNTIQEFSDCLYDELIEF